MSAPHKWGILELKENYVHVMLGPMECNYGPRSCVMLCIVMIFIFFSFNIVCSVPIGRFTYIPNAYKMSSNELRMHSNICPCSLVHDAS